jgi:predicted nucleic acid-binding protein
MIGDVGISSITLAELQYGIEKSTNAEKNREA